MVLLRYWQSKLPLRYMPQCSSRITVSSVCHRKKSQTWSFYMMITFPMTIKESQIFLFLLVLTSLVYSWTLLLIAQRRNFYPCRAGSHAQLINFPALLIWMKHYSNTIEPFKVVLCLMALKTTLLVKDLLLEILGLLSDVCSSH